MSRRFFAAGKDIVMGQEARQLMLEGCTKLAGAVAVTLGPRGRNVIIDQTFGSPKITKDGVTVAKNINFANRYHNLGASLVKQVANNTNDQAGDGTTTATILAQHIFKLGVKQLLHGGNAIEIRKGVLRAVEEICKVLEDLSVQVKGAEDITSVATISANNDVSIGALIGQAMAKLGKDGVVTVQDGKTLDTEIEYVDGMRIDRGYISPYFINSEQAQKCEFEDALVLFVEKKVSTNAHLVPFLEVAAGQLKKPLVIVAEDVESEAITTMVINKLRLNLRVCAVKAPGFGDNRKNTMRDLAFATGGQLISDETDVTLDSVVARPETIPEYFGRVKKVIVTKDETVFMGGTVDKELVDTRIRALEAERETLTSEYDKEKINERVGRLTGRVAVIKVGGSSDVEVGELKDRINDALCATRAAIEEGIVPGGGVALLQADKRLGQVKLANEDQATGLRIVREALVKPIMTICENAGINGEVVLNKIREQEQKNYGYDAAVGEFKDLMKAGIIDPTKVGRKRLTEQVVRTALTDAAGVASLMLTTEAMIVEEEDKKPPAAPGMDGGMGGMGGMGGF